MGEFGQVDRNLGVSLANVLFGALTGFRDQGSWVVAAGVTLPSDTTRYVLPVCGHFALSPTAGRVVMSIRVFGLGVAKAVSGGFRTHSRSEWKVHEQ